MSETANLALEQYDNRGNLERLQFLWDAVKVQ